jgi:hypothetical protein
MPLKCIVAPQHALITLFLFIVTRCVCTSHRTVMFVIDTTKFSILYRNM